MAEGTPAPVGRVGFLAPGLAALALFFLAFLAFLAAFLGFLGLALCLLLADFGLREELFCLVPFPGVGVPEDGVLEVGDEEVDDDDSEVELEVEVEEEGVLLELEVDVVLESEDQLDGVVALELSGHDSDPLTIVAPAGSESWSSGVPWGTGTVFVVPSISSRMTVHESADAVGNAATAKLTRNEAAITNTAKTLRRLINAAASLLQSASLAHAPSTS